MKKLRIGHAGCGSVSLRGILPHVTQPDAQRQLELSAVCDVDGERARAVASQFGARKHYDDFERMVKDDDLDLIVIATPIPLHAQQAELALRHGKHVYVMKSMAVSVEEADRVLRAVEDTGLQYVAAPGQMLAPSIQKIAAMVRDGDFGKLYWGFANNTGGGHGIEIYESGAHTIRRDPTWYYKKPGGGTMFDLTVYSLHSLTGILGPARAVTGMSGIVRPTRQFGEQVVEVEMDDNTWLMLDFGDNCYVTAGSALSQGGKSLFWGQLALFGSDGGIEVTRIHQASGWPSHMHVKRNGRSEEIVVDIREHPLINEAHAAIEEPHCYVDLMHLAECIKNGTKPVASIEHARHVVEIIEKGYLAARTGQRQTLSTTFDAGLDRREDQ